MTKNVHLVTIFFLLLIIFIGLFPKKLGPKNVFRGPLWSSSKLFWPKHWAHVFTGFILQDIKKTSVYRVYFLAGEEEGAGLAAQDDSNFVER